MSWLLNDVIVAQYANPTAFTNGNIMVGYNDLFGSIGEPANFAIFDNLRVETVGPDYDSDGLLDQWEALYFGDLTKDAGTDSDLDGASNGSEFAAGTNPTNAASVFKAISAVRNGNDVEVTWNVEAGHSYVVQRAAAIEDDFLDLSPPISAAAAGTKSYTHVGGGVGVTGFYRVRLAP